mmetsp:Transcript_67239/g.186266  ORF Transcript_67239/g.186266 Transcript_67239/m.186266 type:complete len:218 (-) Transcript_67239:1768-2421(-)
MDSEWHCEEAERPQAEPAGRVVCQIRMAEIDDAGREVSEGVPQADAEEYVLLLRAPEKQRYQANTGEDHQLSVVVLHVHGRRLQGALHGSLFEAIAAAQVLDEQAHTAHEGVPEVEQWPHEVGKKAACREGSDEPALGDAGKVPRSRNIIYSELVHAAEHHKDIHRDIGQSKCQVQAEYHDVPLTLLPKAHPLHGQPDHLVHQTVARGDQQPDDGPH